MRDLILNNFWLKALSLVLATLIWYVINTNLTKESHAFPGLRGSATDNTRDLRCPVTVITSATEHRLLSIQPTEARVRVRGDRTVLEKLSPADIQVYVKLLGLSDPEGSFPLAVDLPGNVALQQLSPSHVSVKFMNSTNN
jgi:YbbR domain-containing protein